MSYCAACRSAPGRSERSARRQSLRGIAQSCALTSFTRENARPWPGDRAEPDAAGDGSGVDQPERGERRTERDEDIRDVAAPPQGEPATAGRDEKPCPVREQWPGEPPGALRREGQREAEPEETVERTDRVQVARAGVEHRRVRVEQREPRVRDGGGTEPDDLREGRGDTGAHPGRAQRPATLARTAARAPHA